MTQSHKYLSAQESINSVEKPRSKRSKQKVVKNKVDSDWEDNFLNMLDDIEKQVYSKDGDKLTKEIFKKTYSIKVNNTPKVVKHHKKGDTKIIIL